MLQIVNQQLSLGLEHPIFLKANHWDFSYLLFASPQAFHLNNKSAWLYHYRNEYQLLRHLDDLSSLLLPKDLPYPCYPIQGCNLGHTLSSYSAYAFLSKQQAFHRSIYLKHQVLIRKEILCLCQSCQERFPIQSPYTSER